ncbi:TPA: hypothetical protein DEP94_01030 [Candidatus Nomurabacteria bacterium]|nr:hypothetical protein [Candidatus Nomurabacteria bacterium]
MHIILSNEAFFQAIINLGIRANYLYSSLITRLGVKPPDGRVVVIVVSQNEWDGHIALFELFEECEALYKKQIDQYRIRYVCCKDLESVRLNPNLEKASFILVVNEDLRDAASYPELKQILPFL